MSALARHHDALDRWVDAHFDDEVRYLQALVQVPTDTPPGNNAPHAERTAELLQAFGYTAERHPVPQDEVQAYGLQSLTNLIVRRRFGDGGRVVALNAHGDVVPPGEGWTHDPYGGEVVDGRLYGRAAAVSKSDFATYTFALRALDALSTSADAPALAGAVELHFTYDEEFGGELGPGFLLREDWGQARMHLSRALELDEENGFYALRLATVHLALGQRAEARSLLQRAQTFEPTRTEAERLLAGVKDS